VRQYPMEDGIVQYPWPGIWRYESEKMGLV